MWPQAPYHAHIKPAWYCGHLGGAPLWNHAPYLELLGLAIKSERAAGGVWLPQGSCEVHVTKPYQISRRQPDPLTARPLPSLFGCATPPAASSRDADTRLRATARCMSTPPKHFLIKPEGAWRCKSGRNLPLPHMYLFHKASHYTDCLVAIYSDMVLPSTTRLRLARKAGGERIPKGKGWATLAQAMGT